MSLFDSQLADALTIVKGLGVLIESLPDEPDWGEGLHLRLPTVIPLFADNTENMVPVAWLVANDFSGYDLTTEDPGS